MNTKNLKTYAPKARRQFMDAVAKRAAHFGIYPNDIAPVSFQGSTAIIEGNAFTKQQGEQRKLLEKRVEEKGYELFVREMAYTWFNRLAALRYMELHDYLEHGFRVLSHPSNKDGSPEILDHAADVADMLGLDKAQIIEWQLAGDKQEVLYRELLLGQCHHLHSVMPFLFEAIDDATELLLPDNLTKTDSILKGLVNDIPEEDWQQIEAIGWLYQFYISEHKDAVIGSVVKSEDIPAATQLFTPNWIVKYLVQNSIGRQWLATYPDSSIKAKMEYYIEPAEQTDEVKAQLAAITPSSIDPESIKALDPAAGSGHILVEIYELLREIYLERGYRQREIPELILTKNIYGLDIDDRAAQLAGFALLMKAREDDRRIFQRVQDGSVKLNVYALQSTEGWDSASLWQALNLDGKAKQGSSGDLFAENAGFQQPTGQYAEYFDLLKHLILSFKQAKTLGSLIQIDHQYLPTLKKFKDKLLDKQRGTDPAAIDGASQLLPVVEQAIVLAQKYDAVIANPPYMGSKGMNAVLKDFAKEFFPYAKADLFAMFMTRAFDLLKNNGNNAQINMQSWMFLSSFESFRQILLKNFTIADMAHLGAKAFSQISGEVVQTTMWVISNSFIPSFRAKYHRLVEGGEQAKSESLKSGAKSMIGLSGDEILSLPSMPISYWMNKGLLKFFKSHRAVGDVFYSDGPMKSGNDDKFLRMWWEVSADDLGSDNKWRLCSKGGEYRPYYGNIEHALLWTKSAQEHYKKDKIARITSESSRDRSGVTWSIISSQDGLAFRLLPEQALFNSVSPTIFCDMNVIVNEENEISKLLCFLNSSTSEYILNLLNPTLALNVGNVLTLPYPDLDIDSSELIDLFKDDWNEQETSIDFQSLKQCLFLKGKLKNAIIEYKKSITATQNRVKGLKKDSDSIWANAFGLQDLISEIDYEKKTGLSTELEGGEEADIVIKLISYYLGCGLGRFSIDRKGLTYAKSQNREFKNLVMGGAYQTFPADDDGIMPLASEDWLFEDDATARFREFVKTVWGAEHLQENLEFVAESLCLDAIKPKKGESAMETIRRYFSTQFFADHCKMYKKRPIYWLFSSGKEKAFECLVYLHRYNEATLSRMRTEYVTPLMGKYDHQLARKMEEVVEASGTEQRRIEKEIKELEKKQLELRKFDEELKHYAEMRITLDLDDGVKENYGKFGNLLANLKDIHGKAVK